MKLSGSGTFSEDQKYHIWQCDTNYDTFCDWSTVSPHVDFYSGIYTDLVCCAHAPRRRELLERDARSNRYIQRVNVIDVHGRITAWYGHDFRTDASDGFPESRALTS